MMMLFGMYSGFMNFGTNYSKPITGNIIAEFELIQNKKSKLSRSERDSVEYRFNKRFKEVFVSPEYKFIIKIQNEQDTFYFDQINFLLITNPNEATRYLDENDPRYIKDLQNVNFGLESGKVSDYTVSLVLLKNEVNVLKPIQETSERFFPL